jgi:hypothetical protein
VLQPVADLLGRADAEIAAGRVWRAKELLRGNLSSRAEPALLERYGRLLEELGDRVEAGRYLFFSGSRLPEYEQPIALFLQRHAKKRSRRALIALIPAPVRRRRFQELPPTLQEDLRRLGVDESEFGGSSRSMRSSGPIAVGGTLPDWLAAAASTAIAMFFFAALVVGVIVICSWLWRLLFG